MSKSQQSWVRKKVVWVRSQHPPTQWNLRGGNKAVLNKVYKKDKSKKFHPFKTVLEFRTIYGARNRVGIGLS
jgi:hypothetical protein